MGDYIKELRKRIGNMTVVLPHSVVLVFNSKNQILIEERADDGFLDFPGGGIDPKESAEEAATRELKEETGLIANELEFFKLYSGEITHYTYFSGDEIYGLDAVYICRDYSGKLIPQLEEVKRLSFYDINNIPLEKLSPRNRQIIIDLNMLINGR